MESISISIRKEKLNWNDFYLKRENILKITESRK